MEDECILVSLKEEYYRFLLHTYFTLVENWGNKDGLPTAARACSRSTLWSMSPTESHMKIGVRILERNDGIHGVVHPYPTKGIATTWRRFMGLPTWQ